jgi:outer membrane protein, adhesin transport system
MIRRIRCIYVALALSTCISGIAQTKPSTLTLEHLFDAAAATYPSLIASRLEAKASAEDVSATERIRWPTISATVESYSGNARSYPSRGLQVDQTVWDFGRNTAKISESQALADISLLKIYLQQQDVFIQMTGAWQNMVSAYERLKVAKLTLERLKGYQAQMRRRVEAEASPRIDLELADARLLQTEVEFTTAQTSLQVALTRLEQFSGEINLPSRIEDVRYPSTLLETALFSKQIRDADWRTIASEHPATAKSRIEVVQIQRRLDSKKAEALPQVFVRLYKPFGTIPSSSDTSTTAFLGMRYSPGAGFSTYAESKAIATRMDGAQQSVEATLRELQQTMQNDSEEFVNARSRMAALEKSVASSALVLESYQRQFQAGRKQWQDLLNQVRELAQNQYALADAQASMVGSMYRLQIRMGQDPK